MAAEPGEMAERYAAVMNLSSSDMGASGGPARDRRGVVNIYHLHPLVAGALDAWAEEFVRIAAMGFSHVCLAPPFAPGGSGDIFVPATLDRLHPALGFDGAADQGIARAAAMARRAGLVLMLDIAPGQVAAESPLRQLHPLCFAPSGSGAVADPRRRPPPVGVAVPRFDRALCAETLAAWWIDRLTRLAAAGVGGFRCLTLDVVPASFWRQLRTALPESLLVAWTPGVPAVRGLAGVGFDFTVSSSGRWDGRASWFFDEQAVLAEVAPALASPEPSFRERRASLLPPDADVEAGCRLALRIAAATGAGLFVPMGFEYAAGRGFDPVRAGPDDMAALRREGAADLSGDVAAAIRLGATLPRDAALRPVTSPAAPVTAMLRADTLLLINPDLVRPAAPGIPLAPLPGMGLSAVGDSGSPLLPGEVRVLPCVASAMVPGGDVALRPDWATSRRIAVEAVAPGGDWVAKTAVGAAFTVSADIVGEGHDVLAAELLWQPVDETEWRRAPMQPIGNDRWEATVRFERIGLHRFVVEGWWDQWGSFAHDLRAKLAAGQDVSLEIREGQALLQASLPNGAAVGGAEAMLAERVRAAMRAADRRLFAARSAVHRVRVDRAAAEFASWYELFPRSATDDPAVPGTFRSVVGRLPYIRAMGFDVLYFPPIHPIGRINRKGRNNSLRAEPEDVGSPYAIGSDEGGHDAVHPALGSLADFRALVAAAQGHGLEIALDLAVQCAPDHPWLAEHKDWFRWRLDGSLRYAENPPKKYEDIVNPEFYNEASFPALWIALRDVVQFWVDQGVRIFRVDNPHTKPLPFWEWLIADIQARHPDVLFLAEAFTRPKLMYRLARIGFTQSYTYFTWRSGKAELTQYLTELTTPPVVEFFRPNFFVNTPDINPVYLQTSGRAGFLIRAALAATLSGLWGVYSGFELCEAAPLPGREEYLDSEKYQIRTRDYRAAGNIVAEIAALNRIRRLHPALQSHRGLAFYNAFNDQVILYGKRDRLDGSMVLVAVSLDPHIVQEAAIEVPLWEFGLDDDAAIGVTDLMAGDSFMWNGKMQHIRLDPASLPFRIWRLEVR